MVSKYPHTATISWLSPGTSNTLTGVWTPGTLNTLVLTECDIQPRSATIGRGESGEVLQYDWIVFAERFTGDTGVPKKAKLTFASADHILVQITNYIKHVEMKCQD